MISKKLRIDKNEVQKTDNDSAHSDNYVKLVDEMIDRAIKERASDIHLEPYFNGKEKARIRFRIDGVLQNRWPVSRQNYLGMLTRIKVMAKMNITEKRLPQDGKFMLPDNTFDIRVSSIPDIRGEKLVLRLLSSNNDIVGIGKLGMTRGQIAMMRRMIERKKGLLLVCGPTGCGKSTTLYSMIQHLSGSAVNITTIEDPVEINMNGITQVQLQETIGLTYGEVLKAMMRQDPDIIMIGEIRDREVAAEAIRFAMTGHQVLTTLHTVNAFGSVKRMLEMGIEPYLLSDVLEGVIAQRLVRRLCPKCREKYLSNDREKELWGIPSETPLYRGKGCPDCGYTGYLGRIGVFEMLMIDEDIKNRIVKGESLSQSCDSRQFWPFSRSIRQLILQGMTSTEEGVRIFGSEKIIG